MGAGVTWGSGVGFRPDKYSADFPGDNDTHLVASDANPAVLPGLFTDIHVIASQDTGACPDK